MATSGDGPDSTDGSDGSDGAGGSDGADRAHRTSRWRAAAAVLLAALGVVGIVAAVRRPLQTPAPPRLTAMPSTAPSTPGSGTGSGTDSGTGSGVPSSPSARASDQARQARTVPPLPSSVPVRLRIPSIDVNSPLIRLGVERDGSMQVPPGAFPAGWFTQGPAPGARGPAVIAGHVTYNGAGVFFRLGQVRPGAKVDVVRQDGRTATFAVTAVQEYPKDQFPTAAVYGPTDGPELRLITCTGDFDSARHHYVDDLVVYARMVSSS